MSSYAQQTQDCSLQVCLAGWPTSFAYLTFVECHDNRLVELGMATHAQKKSIVPLAVKPPGNVLLVPHKVHGNHQKENTVPFESLPSFILFCLLTICHHVIYFLGISSSKYVVCINSLRGLRRPSDIFSCKHNHRQKKRKGSYSINLVAEFHLMNFIEILIGFYCFYLIPYFKRLKCVFGLLYFKEIIIIFISLKDLI